MFNHYYYHIWYLKVKQLKYRPILDTISTFYIITVFALSIYFHVNKLRYITASNFTTFPIAHLFILIFEMSLRINNQQSSILDKDQNIYREIIRVDFVSWFFQKEILLIFTYLFLLFRFSLSLVYHHSLFRAIYNRRTRLFILSSDRIPIYTIYSHCKSSSSASKHRIKTSILTFSDIIHRY